MSKLFWAMLAFISRLPVPSRWSQGLDFEQYSRGIVMFPFIGLILGGVPLILVDGEVALAGRYPRREELARWMGLTVYSSFTPAASSCCGGDKCC